VHHGEHIVVNSGDSVTVPIPPLGEVPKVSQPAGRAPFFAGG
jgi:hypothetical protein